MKVLVFILLGVALCNGIEEVPLTGLPLRSFYGDPELAIDAGQDTCFVADGINQFWSVDLGTAMNIASVEILACTAQSNTGSDLNDIHIIGSIIWDYLEDDDADWDNDLWEIGTFPGSVARGKTVTITAAADLPASRFVIIWSSCWCTFPMANVKIYATPVGGAGGAGDDEVSWGLLDGAPEGHQYAFIAPAPSWFDSVDSCDMMGGYLVEIGSAEENAAVAKYARDHYDDLGLTGTSGRVWIGGSDDSVEGTWIWENSQNKFDAGYTNWDTTRNQPNDARGVQNCASFFFKKSDRWDDDTCESNHKAYICERTVPDDVEPIVDPAPIVDPPAQNVDENLETSDFTFDVSIGMSAAGAECHRMDDLHECQELCWVMEDCFGIDWNHAANPWCHCWIHRAEPGPLSPNANVDHYVKAFIAPMD